MQAITRYNGSLYGVVRKVEDFGFATYDLAAPPARLAGSPPNGTVVEHSIEARRVEPVPTLSSLVQKLPAGEHWLGVSQRTLARVLAAFLVAEDPQRRLEAQKTAILTHQVSLVQHVLENPDLRKVLIADEVGLGKTIEAGLLIKRLVEAAPQIRVLYLAPARLVSNVAYEFRDKLDLNARSWVAGSAADARLGDDRIVIASIQKAVFGENVQKVAASGPWDVIVVDECHHLSDWGYGGGKPNRSYSLVRQLIDKQTDASRLILLSGTPHQGSEARFENILRLLAVDGKDLETASGKVIFRTKDRVRDWQGKPLFPSRDVRPPRVIALGREYEEWYEAVGALYDSSTAMGARGRASGWAKGQALQWAASSVEAGLGFLVRLALRRIGWGLENPAFRDAVSALRPYRKGPVDEPLESLLQRLRKQVNSQTVQEDLLVDEEDLEEGDWRPNPEALARLLRVGASLVNMPTSQAKWNALAQIIKEANGEKIVLFAQPVETVVVVARFLERRYGQRPSLIIGDQTDEERSAEVKRFQSDAGPQFLVSSRAGGEGLNMQRARRLIHLDVPWNPMDLEQRVGRVHRFGSRKTIIVDTIVASGSREVEMYRAARDKLRLISRQLAPEEFEVLFSRVMALVPPKELEEILGARHADESARNDIGLLVSKGFELWQKFDEEYRVNADKIRNQDAGQAQWDDLANFLVKYAGATLGTGTMRASFSIEETETGIVEEKLATVILDGQDFAVGELGGLPSDSNVHQLGLNVPVVARALRDAFLPEKTVGVAYLTRPTSLGSDIPRGSFALLVFLRQTLRYAGDRASEDRLSLHVYLVESEKSEIRELESMTSSNIIRRLQDASRIRDPKISDLEDKLETIESAIIQSLRKLSASDLSARTRHVVWPLGAIIVAPG